MRLSTQSGLSGTTDPDASSLTLVFTDGEENHSFAFNAARIRTLMADKQATGRWTFAFQMPPGAGKRFTRAVLGLV